MTKTINELSKEYDLELEKVVLEIKSLPKGEKLVLLQFSDGLKPYATAVVDYLEEKTDVIFLIWLGDCFGACDTPNLGTAGCIPLHCVPGISKKMAREYRLAKKAPGTKPVAQARTCYMDNVCKQTPKSLGQDIKVDLVVQFGHNEMMPSY